MTQAHNLVFVDNITWDRIEQALSPGVRAELAESGHQWLHETGEITAAPLSGRVGWASLILFDPKGNPIHFVRGGRDARLEYEQRMENND